jgi:hypothetical protein
MAATFRAVCNRGSGDSIEIEVTLSARMLLALPRREYAFTKCLYPVWLFMASIFDRVARCRGVQNDDAAAASDVEPSVVQCNYAFRTGFVSCP